MHIRVSRRRAMASGAGHYCASMGLQENWNSIGTTLPCCGGEAVFRVRIPRVRFGTVGLSRTRCCECARYIGCGTLHSKRCCVGRRSIHVNTLEKIYLLLFVLCLCFSSIPPSSSHELCTIAFSRVQCKLDATARNGAQCVYIAFDRSICTKAASFQGTIGKATARIAARFLRMFGAVSNVFLFMFRPGVGQSRNIGRC